jgi:Ca2+-binding RTX toxin-like protein
MAVINGTSGADTLADTSGNDTINGLGGNDIINGGHGGTDVVNGGDGRDSLQFMTAAGPVVVDFVAGTAGTTSFTNIEKVVTGDFDDRLTGNALAQNLTARAGADTLAGGGGIDTLWGGSGNDTFVFRETGTANTDSIADWTSGSDTLLLDGAIMTALGASGDFTAGDARFWASSSGTAHDADDRIIYETDTRQVWYDADGNGAGARQLIATLQSGATLVATDIAVEGGGGGSEGRVINGTAGDDSIAGSAGDDTINGLGGNDTLVGEEGVDAMLGGDGDDVLQGRDGAFASPGASEETLDGGLGNDTFHADAADDVILDAGGVDRLVVYDMSWTLAAGFEHLTLRNDESESGFTGIGNELDNHVEATWAGSRLEGRDGDDTLVGASGQGGPNVLLGGAGDDSLVSGGMDDRLDGGLGVDTLIGLGAEIGDGESFVFSVAPGAANADVIVHFEQFSRIVLDGAAMQQIGPSGALDDARFSANSTGTAQDASDRVVYNTSNGQLWYDADGNGSGAAQLIATLQSAPDLVANDIMVENGTAQPPDGQVINGTSGADTLADTAGNDTINGLAGNDTINGGHGGNDVVNGGDGRDSLQFMTATGAVIVDFVAGTAGNTSFTSIEKVVTGDFNDTLTGNAAAQNLTARAGADTLAGAGGLDTLWGGAGADTFVFRETGTANADSIADWTSATDEIALDNSALTALGADGDFVAGDARFWASSTGVAHDANDRVIYNTSTRGLYYDADGSGSGAAQLIATVQAGATVAATDIVVI